MFEFDCSIMTFFVLSSCYSFCCCIFNFTARSNVRTIFLMNINIFTGVRRCDRGIRHTERGQLQRFHPDNATVARQPHSLDQRHAGRRGRTTGGRRQLTLLRLSPTLSNLIRTSYSLSFPSSLTLFPSPFNSSHPSTLDIHTSIHSHSPVSSASLA